ncbi:hypothetical protein AciM339_0016 [Aciduliprofundum sp. MAR08-339]|uniref:hypothetical protein n=1 Tax=Aciduliprofundum sp. (strain MAR08-339) TaxID=673860 RepID=UPI0002A4C962|nr:hypothetical protein AciM339_0016 [Aciduliprofundum sp. MAR08-339]
MLRTVFEEVAPYISNLDRIKKFVDENEGKSPEELRNLLAEMIENSEGTLRTDFRILLNEFEKTINKR